MHWFCRTEIFFWWNHPCSGRKTSLARSRSCSSTCQLANPTSQFRQPCYLITVTIDNLHLQRKTLLRHFNYRSFTTASFSVATLRPDPNFTTSKKRPTTALLRESCGVLRRKRHGKGVNSFGRYCKKDANDDLINFCFVLFVFSDWYSRSSSFKTGRHWRRILLAANSRWTTTLLHSRRWSLRRHYINVLSQWCKGKIKRGLVV